MSHSGSCECFSYTCGNELVDHLSVNATADVHVVSVDWRVPADSWAFAGPLPRVPPSSFVVLPLEHY
ncbi:hypothetical protein Tco_1560627 [Tanacetum coccineum]